MDMPLRRRAYDLAKASCNTAKYAEDREPDTMMLEIGTSSIEFLWDRPHFQRVYTLSPLTICGQHSAIFSVVTLISNCT